MTTTTAFFYFLFAAYLAGIGSAVMVFGLFIRAADGGHRSAGCFVRTIVWVCFIAALYLTLVGGQFLVSRS